MILADIETLMKLMNEHNIESLEVKDVKMKLRPALPDMSPFIEAAKHQQRKFTDEEILSDPYKGMDE